VTEAGTESGPRRPTWATSAFLLRIRKHILFKT
jgi:hypothetical protein